MSLQCRFKKQYFDVSNFAVTPKTPKLTASTGTGLTVSKNAAETLTCHTDSKGTVTYVFYNNGHDVKTDAHSSTYKVPTSSAGSISYTCAVTISGAKSAASSAVAIHVVGRF